MICLSILASVTLAYYTDSATARNVITSGGIQIQIVEEQLVDGTLQPYPNQPITIMPATTVSKVVSVQNLEEAAWVRANYTITVYDSDGIKMEIPSDELNKMIIIDPNSTDWTQKDGWWYCNEVVQTEEKSKPLFENVAFSGPYMDNKYQCGTVLIEVSAQAVQQANNGSTVMEAAGWPAE
jgi:predicted ribosomally synthesized peptide with SipW-like signal peptide